MYALLLWYSMSLPDVSSSLCSMIVSRVYDDTLSRIESNKGTLG